jgi:hypothetical protein
MDPKRCGNGHRVDKEDREKKGSTLHEERKIRKANKPQRWTKSRVEEEREHQLVEGGQPSPPPLVVGPMGNPRLPTCPSHWPKVALGQFPTFGCLREAPWGLSYPYMGHGEANPFRAAIPGP